jgi:hypothetical protein
MLARFLPGVWTTFWRAIYHAALRAQEVAPKSRASLRDQQQGRSTLQRQLAVASIAVPVPSASSLDSESRFVVDGSGVVLDNVLGGVDFGDVAVFEPLGDKLDDFDTRGVGVHVFRKDCS